MENSFQQWFDMAAVHGFYVTLLKDKLGFDVPVPSDIQAAVGGKNRVERSVDSLVRWLALLDLAITPVMIRDALRLESTRKESAEALLRYFHHKHSSDEADRDKSDFVITFLFRYLKMPLRSGEEWSLEDPSSFEQEIYVILGINEPLILPEEHRHLVREFPFIRQEVEDIHDFDRLMDSGIMQRVRDIKQRFGPSLYHPRVLSTIAEYNVFIGNRFDELFRQAAHSIKQFASSVQAAGASIMSRVEGDVTVKHLADVEGERILEKEYGKAQEHLRNVSTFKKVVDRRRKSSTPPAPAATLHPHPGPAAQPALIHGGGSAAEIGKSLDKTVEEGKIATMLESIRNFILAANTKSANVFPMRNGNLPITAAELDAFKAEYRGEKSFRGDFALGLTEAVSIFARMLVEVEELRQKQYSAYLWKPHADSLTFLLQRANRLQEECAAILTVAENRGLVEKAKALSVTLQKLRQQSMSVAKLLETVGPAK